MQEYTKEIEDIWRNIIEDSQEVIGKEPLLEDLVDDVIIKSENVFEAISKRLARKLGQNAIYEENLRKLFNKIFIRDEFIARTLIENLKKIASEDDFYNSYSKVILYSRKFQLVSADIIATYLLNNGKEDIALYIKGLIPSE